MSGRFKRTLSGDPLAVPPVWMMRQAGRYHSAYQKLRASHSFEALCRTPALAAEVALGPVEDFDFDAAILFSDLLFPLQALGMHLSYDDGPPQLDGPIDRDRLARFRPIDEAAARMAFQAEAVARTRGRLPGDRGLIGFVGGPWTLFVYAIEGRHTGALTAAKGALQLYREFADRVVPLIGEMAGAQLAAGADMVMVLDTAAGELSPAAFAQHVVADLTTIAESQPGRLGYYGKGLHTGHITGSGVGAAPWAGLGYDHRWDLSDVLANADRRGGFVQGNFDPAMLCLTGDALEREIAAFLEPVRQLDSVARRGWICGLGHGVLPPTPESSVRTFVARVREAFA